MVDLRVLRLLFVANVALLGLAMYDFTIMPNDEVAFELGMSIAGTAASTWLLSVVGDLD